MSMDKIMSKKYEMRDKKAQFQVSINVRLGRLHEKVL